MRKYEEFKTTTNRSVYNKAYKNLNAGCAYCGWNSGCNTKNKYYHIHEVNEIKQSERKPNWKLVSKNKKQWMKKILKLKSNKHSRNGRVYYEIKW